MATCQEIMKREHIEEALRQSEERFRLMVSCVKDYGILMLDPSGRVITSKAFRDVSSGAGWASVKMTRLSCHWHLTSVSRGMVEGNIIGTIMASHISVKIAAAADSLIVLTSMGEGLSSGNLNAARCPFRAGAYVSFLAGSLLLILWSFHVNSLEMLVQTFSPMVPSTVLGLVTAGAFLVILKDVEIDESEPPLSPSRSGKNGRTFCRGPRTRTSGLPAGNTEP